MGKFFDWIVEDSKPTWSNRLQRPLKWFLVFLGCIGLVSAVAVAGVVIVPVMALKMALMIPDL